ncbi:MULTISPECIES: putative manganese-dependent inorganic diphosphatase [Psychrilyobacter]|uniref:inorganic diphosphatase n=1 Tax=Psychrilyobacter piezotolerans TaxID=2293438 RepID=A0ABX9KI00_9FUSO|nr:MULTISPECIES: putative manganese-dependent inorganic diphosphatase [Psychrilyobacter]MCS5420703.1 putative manganese-dependent inorganic diphosphatase [Psychrilyobacter sp. S5]NDI78021.1 putative manganese-dependent inorganic diphosphatase [Psychrilyobacter piezotolerans]RDE61960.1 putative manganese-dependent inorganic diphosphatase [Psychrilyobacter sp. S5]REI41186.1 putative manganese-dependent inorganic diphosphatase [Psychrilyobacter piezotolerans]
MKEKVLIFGHKNPDTDSICSAIAYSNLKDQLGLNTKAVRLGEINKETEFILNHFNVATPQLLTTIKPQVKDLTKVEKELIKETDSIQKALEIMTTENYSSLPVVNKNNKLENMIHISEIANAYLEMSTRDIFLDYETTFENVWETLKDDAVVLNGVYPAGKIEGRLRGVSELAKISKGDVVITTLFSGHIKNAEKAGAKIIFLCVDKNDEIPDYDINIPLVRVNKGIFKTFKMISQSVPVKAILKHKNFFHFETTDFIEDIQDIMKDSSQTNFPVVNKDGTIFSTIRSKHIMNFGKNEVILVDHNENSQSVDGIETAKILEIVDHHKFGNFETSEPLMIRASAVGCTSTIIYGLFKEEGITPDKTIAGLMLSAILSDTLIFKSPTCTPKDVEAAKELAVIADLDYEKYGMEMLIAGTSLGDKTPDEIITMDMKEFSMGKFQTAVAQINTVDIDGLLNNRENLESAMNGMIDENNYDLFLLVMTDIVNNGSKILALGNSTELVEKGFNVELETGTAWLDGVVSRKKQIVPFLMAASQGM